MANAVCRDAVLQYVSKGATLAEHDRLVQTVTDGGCEFLAPLLELAWQLGSTRRCPAPIADFLDTVVRDSPAFGSYVSAQLLAGRTAATTSALDDLIVSARRGDGALPPALVEPVRLHFTALSKLCSAVGWRVLGPAVLPLLEKLRRCAPPEHVTVEGPDVVLRADQDDEDTWAPMFPPQPDRPHKAYGSLEAGERRCTKHVVETRTLTEGLVVAYCPHGIAIAVIVLNRHEGPLVCFELFWRRFKHAPKLIVYDNGCTLHKVNVAREPVFFRNTENSIDGFHQPVHTTCTKGYALRSRPDDYPIVSAAQLETARQKLEAAGLPFPKNAAPITIGNFNSQAAEQYNSQLRKIERSCSMMSRPSYIRLVRAFCYRWNVRKLAKMYGVSEMEMLGTVHDFGRLLPHTAPLRPRPKREPRPRPKRQAVEQQAVEQQQQPPQQQAKQRRTMSEFTHLLSLV